MVLNFHLNLKVSKQIAKFFKLEFVVFSLIKCKHLSLLFKEMHVTYVQQTKNKIPPKQQFLKNIYKQHTQM